MNCEDARRVVVVPVVVKPVVVPVPGTVVIAIEVENVTVAVRVAHQLYEMPSMTPPLDCSQGCTVFGI